MVRSRCPAPQTKVTGLKRSFLRSTPSGDLGALLVYTTIVDLSYPDMARFGRNVQDPRHDWAGILSSGHCWSYRIHCATGTVKMAGDRLIDYCITN